MTRGSMLIFWLAIIMTDSALTNIFKLDSCCFQEFGDSARARRLYADDDDDEEEQELEPNPKLAQGMIKHLIYREEEV